MIIVQYKNSGTNPFYDQCIDTVHSVRRCDYRLVGGSCIGNPAEYTRLARCDLLVQNPFSLWLDIDCVLKKWFDFEFIPDRPYAYSHGCHAAALYANGATETIKRMRDYVDRTKQCPCGYVRDNKSEFEFFPDGYISHLKIGGVINTKFHSWGNSECQIVTDENGKYKLMVNK